MKKFTLLFLGIMSLFVILGCSVATTTNTTLATTELTTLNPTTLTPTTVEPTTIAPTTVEPTTLSKLSTPTNIQVIDNTITFSGVESAEKYRVYVYSMTDELLGEYNIASGFNLSFLFSLGSYKLRLKATANNYLESDLTDFYEFSIINPNQVNSLEAEEMNNVQYIRWMGRTYYNETEAVKYFYFTASGFEVAFYGTELKVTLKASNYSVSGKQPYLVAMLDGEEDPTKGTLFMVDSAEKEYTIYSGLEDGYHTVKILKRSEASDSNTALKNITTDGYFTFPPQPKSFRLEFIAASSSTGYGNLGSLALTKTTANSDGLRAFAYLTSFLLDSEISIFSASGWGVSRGYNTGGAISETQNIPNAYEYVAIDSSNTVFTLGGKWDTSNYVPDVVVVNLGTNDFNAANYSAMSQENKDLLVARFIQDYTDFLILLNNFYPNAKIIVAYGLMNEQANLEQPTLAVINQANLEIGSTVVYPFLMEGAGTLGNPYGSNYHPNVQTSMNVAEDLAALISSLTGRQIIREMID